MIGVITTSYPRGAQDWAGAFVRDRVRTLVRDGQSVQVIAAGTGDAVTEDVPEPGVELVRVPFGVAGAIPLFYGGGAPEALESGSWRAWLAGWRFWCGLAEAVRRKSSGWQSVESHWLAPCSLAVVAAAGPRARGAHRAFAHSGDVALLERLTGGAGLARLLVRSGIGITFVSEDLRGRFIRLCAGVRTVREARMEVASMPVDTQRFFPPTPALRSRLRRGFGLARPTVMGVGRLVPVKGFDVLVRAVAALPFPDRPRVVIAGEGAGRAELAGLADRLCVDLKLLGAVAHEDIADWMHAADVFVQPSRILASGRCEGMPLAAREALAAGLPIVASATGGLRELARNGDSVVLVPPDDPNALSHTLRSILSYRAAGCALDVG